MTPQDKQQLLDTLESIKESLNRAPSLYPTCKKDHITHLCEYRQGSVADPMGLFSTPCGSPARRNCLVLWEGTYDEAKGYAHYFELTPVWQWRCEEHFLEDRERPL